MKKTLKRIAPLQFGKISAIFCFGITMILFPIFAILIRLHVQFSGFPYPYPLPPIAEVIIPTIIGTIIVSIINAVMAFPTGVVSAWIYNLTARLLGGIQIDLEEIHGPNQ